MITSRPHASHGRYHREAGRAVVVVIVVVVVALAGALTGLTMLGRVRQQKQQERSREQMRTIGLALAVYSIDHKNRFPGENWQEALMNSDGGMSPILLRAPQADEGVVSYFYVPNLKNDMDPTQVLLYENPTINRNRGANVLFADGNVVWLDRDQLWAVIDNITLEDGTVYRPHRQQP